MANENGTSYHALALAATVCGGQGKASGLPSCNGRADPVRPEAMTQPPMRAEAGRRLL